MREARSRLRLSTYLGSPSKGSHLGVRMSHIMRATAFCLGRHGRMRKVVGSGMATMSLSSMRVNP